MYGCVGVRRVKAGPIARLYAALKFAVKLQLVTLDVPVIVEQSSAVSTSSLSLDSPQSAPFCVINMSQRPSCSSSMQCSYVLCHQNIFQGCDDASCSSPAYSNWQKFLWNFSCPTEVPHVLVETFAKSSATDWNDRLNQKSDCMNDDDANDAPFVDSLSAWTLNC